MGLKNYFLAAIVVFLFGNSQSKAQQIEFLKTNVVLEPVYQSSVAFSDMDNDGDNDLLLTGRTSGSGHTSRLYLNDGSGSFMLIPNTGLTGASGSSIAFADIDFDNDDDLLITGQASGSPLVIVSKLYTNDGAGNFSEVSNVPFSAVNNSAVAFSDIDGNGTPDLVITGDGGGSNYVAELYLCDSSGQFTLIPNAFSQGVRYSAVAFADVDNDLDNDLIIAGLAFSNPSTIHIAKLYLNDGNGMFTEQPGTPFTGVANATIAFADVDNDNDQDVFIAGGTSGSGKSSALYLNDGFGVFSLSNQTFTEVNKASAKFSDIDLDGDFDLILSGESAVEGNITRVYENSAGTFTELSGMGITGVGEGDITLADVNGDSLPDLLITGDSGGGNYVSELYINTTILFAQNEIGESRHLYVFPNPGNGEFDIKLNDVKPHWNSTILVYDLHGRVVFENRMKGAKAQINLHYLPEGSYFLQLRSHSYIDVKRIVITNTR